jgi:MYXO-CTERM domain-containing protein
VRIVAASFAQGPPPLIKAGMMKRLHFLGLGTSAALALSALSLVPAASVACTGDMYVEEPLLVLGTWPAQDEAAFPTDGIIRVQIARIAVARRIEEALGARLTDLDTATEVALELKTSPNAPGDEVLLIAQTPWRADGRYRLELRNLDTDTVVADLTWQVGSGPAPALAFAAQPDAWCLDQVEVLGECIGGWGSCSGCTELAASTVQTQARLTLTLPDSEALAQNGRYVVQVGERGGRSALRANDTYRTWWGEGFEPTCIDLEIQTRQGQAEAQLHACPPATLAACTDLTFAGEAPVAGHRDGGPDADGGAGSGSLDAGLDANSGGSAADSEADADGCQAGPGAPAAPLFAGLLALGLLRRRRRG